MAKKKQEQIEVVEQSKAMEIAIQAMEKAHGKGVVLFGKSKPMQGVVFNSSGCLGLDRIMGGGYGEGRIVEIYGPESSGKTTLAIHAMAVAQKKGDLVAFVDVEHAFDPSYATALGVDLEKMAFSQPNSGEQALQVVEALCGAASIIVVDSVSALLPQAEIEKEIGDSTVGRQAGLMSQAMRKLAPLAAKTKTTIIFINQIRKKIGVMFGNPETTSGGEALKFYASQRLDVRRIGGVKNGDEIIANRTRIKVVKSKLYPPFKQVELNIVYGKGIDIAGDILERAVEANIIQKSGSWYSIGERKLGQGQAAVTTLLESDSELFHQIWTQLTIPEAMETEL